MKTKQIEIFFKVLEKFKQLENNHTSPLPRLIFIFKNPLGYNIYFGIRKKEEKNLEKAANGTEEDFIKKYYEDILVPYTGVYQGNVSEDELDYILYIFNMKYIGAIFHSFDKEEKIIEFWSNQMNTTIYIPEKKGPTSIKEHVEGTKLNTMKYALMMPNEKTLSINQKKVLSIGDYIAILNYFKNSKEPSILSAYRFTYQDFIKHILVLSSANPNKENNSTHFETAEEFLKR